MCHPRAILCHPRAILCHPRAFCVIPAYAGIQSGWSCRRSAPPYSLSLRAAGRPARRHPPLLGHSLASPVPLCYIGRPMKEKIHPKYQRVQASCACGASFDVGSTKENIRVDICSQCHPLFTGQEKIIDTAGRVDRFKQRYAKKSK